MSSNGPMVSEVSICNQALTWLGQDPLSSLDDRSATAEWMRNNYPFLRDAVLEERMWTFATRRLRSETAARDEFDVQYAHDIDSDWLGVYRVYRHMNSALPDAWPTADGWRREGDKILTNESVSYLWGLRRVTDPGKFTGLFTQALAARLAADAAIPLTENRALQADMWNLYQTKLADAAVRDGMQGTAERVGRSSMVTRRYGGRYG